MMKAINILLITSILLPRANGQWKSSNSIDCKGEDACFDGYTLDCIDDIDCTVECIGKNACQKSLLNCPIDADCLLTCGDIEADCHEFEIRAEQSTSLTINCGNGPESCAKLTIYCPTNTTLSPGCIINGLTALNCDNGTWIYAVNGLDDVLITGTNPQPIELFCKQNYDKNCEITNNDFTTCDTGDAVCNKDSTNTPTTLNPSTSDPTTAMPSTMPNTTAPTYNPTVFPTKSSTTVPTNDPTDTPTKMPINSAINTVSKIPTSNPTAHDKNGEIAETTGVTKVENDIIKHSSNNNTFWIVMGVLLVIIIICILCAVFMIRLKLKKEVISHAQSNIKLHLDNKNKHKHSIVIGELDENKVSGTHSIPVKNESIQDTNSNPSHLPKDAFIIDDGMTHQASGAPQINKFDNGLVLIAPGSLDSHISEHKSNTFGNSNFVVTNNAIPENNFDALKQSELDKIKKWLTNFRMHMYFDLFIINGYDSMDIIKEIENKSQLQDIGIVLKGHLQKISVEIQKLNQYENDNDNTGTDEGTNEDVTDPPTEEGDTPNDDTDSSDVNISTKGDLQHNVNVNVNNQILIDDDINNINKINETPQ